jgi:hypothetical protein
MKSILVALFIISGQAMAANCISEVNADFQKQEPKLQVREVSQKGSLKAGEDRPYLQGEIFNNKKITLDIYEIESFFMASFVHVALVDPSTCKVESLTEVLFE